MTVQQPEAPNEHSQPARVPRRHKAQFHLWLDPDTGAALRALAADRAVPATVLAEAFIRAGLGQMAEERLEGPALPAVRSAVDDALRPQVERLAALIVKTHLEAGIGERLTFVLIAQTFGEEKARRFLDMARTRSIEALRRPLGEPKSGE